MSRLRRENVIRQWFFDHCMHLKINFIHVYIFASHVHLYFLAYAIVFHQYILINVKTLTLHSNVVLKFALTLSGSGDGDSIIFAVKAQFKQRKTHRINLSNIQHTSGPASIIVSGD